MITPGGQAAIATIVACNYLAHARVLARSLREHHPDVPFFTLIADAHCDEPSVEAPEPFHTVRPSDLGLPDLEGLTRGRSRQGLSVTLKPFLLQHLLDRGFARVIFLDPDILVVAGIDDVLEDVGRHPLVLTPHLLEPPGDAARHTRELTILQAGTFNGGFVGVSNVPVARQILAWWQDRLRHECGPDVGRGMYYDQRWLDLAPVLFDGVRVLRDPGCNIAYWNLTERAVRCAGQQILVNHRPARFFHFSGFDPLQPQLASRHAPTLRVDAFGPDACVIYQRYAELLIDAGYEAMVNIPYGFESQDAAY